MSELERRLAGQNAASPDIVRASVRGCGHLVLVFQGGGALGSYQAGVYQALHEAGLDPDWVIGTSIGAVNAALIAGNGRSERLAALRDFWRRVAGDWGSGWLKRLGSLPIPLGPLFGGVAGFFTLRHGIYDLRQRMGIEQASFYSADPLHATLAAMISPNTINANKPRLTVGAVNIRSGELEYFDSRSTELKLEHIMASGALPPGFPAVRVGTEYYWDGGLYSNTPVEAVLDDNPRRSSLILCVNLWQPLGHAPENIWNVLGRQKDIQYASRLRSHVARQQQIHRLRHVIRGLEGLLPEDERNAPSVKEMTAYGCSTTMHLAVLQLRQQEGEDYMKDIDFSRAGIDARWQAGLRDAAAMLDKRPWDAPADPLQGVIVHELEDQAQRVAAPQSVGRISPIRVK